MLTHSLQQLCRTFIHPLDPITTLPTGCNGLLAQLHRKNRDHPKLLMPPYHKMNVSVSSLSPPPHSLPLISYISPSTFCQRVFPLHFGSVYSSSSRISPLVFFLYYFFKLLPLSHSSKWDTIIFQSSSTLSGHVVILCLLSQTSFILEILHTHLLFLYLPPFLSVLLTFPLSYNLLSSKLLF